MCMQTVGLIQAEIERHGIPTVSISLLREVTSVIRPPRALFVPFRLGYPLGEPNNPEIQHLVLAEALELLNRNTTPLLVDYETPIE